MSLLHAGNPEASLRDDFANCLFCLLMRKRSNQSKIKAVTVMRTPRTAKSARWELDLELAPSPEALLDGGRRRGLGGRAGKVMEGSEGRAGKDTDRLDGT